MKNRYIAFTVCLALAGTIACKKKKDEEPAPVAETPVVAEVNLKAQFLTTYANIAHSTASEALGTAGLLKAAIDVFVATPTPATLTACKTAYETARKAYLQTEAFRGVSGPVEEVEGFMNSWPLDEAYIDFVFNTTNDPVINTDTLKVNGGLNGIVNDLNRTIDKSTLASLNTLNGDANVSIGFHAIEFLLWGQDISATTAGTRPDTDFLTSAKATAPNGARRGLYLKVCAELLIDNLTTVANAWKPGVTGNYRTDLLDPKNRDSRMTTIMSGMTNLTQGEFAGERISPALENKDQEEEHSCFSDLTKLDFKYDVLGYENIILGKHTLQSGAVSVNGTGLKALLESVSAEKATGLLTAINTLKTSTEAVFTSSARYDQTILKANTDPEVVKVQTMANDWSGLSTALRAATVAFGYVVAAPEE